jgi:L-amino acid N-acyltransferase YncA
MPDQMNETRGAETLVVRVARPSDDAILAAIYAPHVEQSATSFELEAPSPKEMAARIRGTLDRYPWLVAERDGTILGYAYATEHRARRAYQWGVEVSVYIRDDAQRQGVGRQLYTRLFELLRQQGFYTAYAGITLPNPASVGLHEALGFLPVGVYRNAGFKLGTWHDVGWWQLALQPVPPNPSPPTPFAQLVSRGSS